jgi:hypothetical protein
MPKSVHGLRTVIHRKGWMGYIDDWKLRSFNGCGVENSWPFLRVSIHDAALLSGTGLLQA